jgi:hypothetical protein
VKSSIAQKVASFDPGHETVRAVAYSAFRAIFESPLRCPRAFSVPATLAAYANNDADLQAFPASFHQKLDAFRTAGGRWRQDAFAAVIAQATDFVPTPVFEAARSCAGLRSSAI